MAENYVLLETIELSQTAASVVFDNIPQTGYTDLKIVTTAREATSQGDVVGYIRFNADTGTTNYSAKSVYGDGTAVASLGNSGAAFFLTLTGNTASTFASSEIYIPNYTSSQAKSWSADMATENNGSSAFAALYAGLWTGTAAISTITLSPRAASSLAANSTFSLYALAATGTTPVTAPFASGGNIVANDGTYWYHAFLSSGTFTPAKALTCDYLVVAGGGGGGRATSAGTDYGAGGGAGGLRSTVTSTGGLGTLESVISVTSQAYAITVGAGGAAQSTVGTAGNNGTNSTFSTITSTGGGGGAGGSGSQAGKNGGSGGGAALGGAAGIASPSGQGFAGGAYAGSGYGAGGGGAGAVGASTSAQNTAGGAGVAISTFASPTNTGVSNFYAAGGRGGSTSPSDGTANTGNGGDGRAGTGSPAGAGASGIVIIRYPMV
jgi:hypothetical protein